MNNPTFIAGGIAWALLALGCSEPAEKQASTKDLNFEEQLMAVLPLADQAHVLKICNTGKGEALSMSILSEKPDPGNPGQTVPTDPIPVEKQLSGILTLVDKDHSLNIRQVTDPKNGQRQLEFTIH